MIMYEDGEVALAVLPFFHIYGMQVLMNGLLSNGVTVVSMPRFDMEQGARAHPEAQGHPVLRRPADRARPGEASGRR